MSEARPALAVIGLVGKSIFMEVPHFHRGGETIHVDGYHEEWGGKGFNQAVAAARQGALVSFFGKVGTAVDAASVMEVCRAEEIEPHVSSSDTAEKTALAAILTDPAGETHVTVAPGAVLTVTDLGPELETAISASAALILNNEMPDDVNVFAARLAAKHLKSIICNPAPARPIPDELKTLVAVFTPNEVEEAALGDVPGEVVTTLGPRGCRIRSTGEVLPPPKVGKVVDTTGAGDTFTGVFAARLAAGLPLRDACLAANAAAAASVTRRYVLPSIPRPSSILQEGTRK